MPYIRTTTNKALDLDKKEALKDAFGKLIEIIPGKSEQWLMLSVLDGVYTAFRGDGETAAAMVEVDLLGKADPSKYEQLTEAICREVCRIAGIAPDRIYVKYGEYASWGYNGFNF